jgi:hypothetical protein
LQYLNEALFVFILFFVSLILFGYQDDGSTTFPIELEGMIGDPMLFKLKKTDQCDSCGSMLIEIIDIFCDPRLIYLYVNPEHPIFAGNVSC